MSSFLSDDWSKGDVESWSGKDLGNCYNNVTFPSFVSGLDVTLLKKKGKTDNLVISNITVEAETTSPKSTQRLSFGPNYYTVGESFSIYIITAGYQSLSRYK